VGQAPRDHRQYEYCQKEGHENGMPSQLTVDRTTPLAEGGQQQQYG